MSEWDYEKNRAIGLDPKKLLAKSNKKAWWKCPEGHSWAMEIYHRTDGRKCPFCSNKRVLVGFNDLDTLYPDVAKEWNSIKNVGLDIHDFVIGSNKIVWWKCAFCNHEWKASIQSRTLRHSGCPECAKIKRGQTRHKTELANGEPLHDPPLLSEWDYERNECGPENYLPGSNKYVYWKCRICGYEWKAKIANRAILKRGCPCCANKVAVPGKNDLATTNPDLAQEWHPHKNGDLKPQQVLVGSARKVWWLCPKGHEYRASLLHRGHGTNCPICNSGRQTSFAEQAFFYYIKQIFPDAESRVKGIIGRRMELDIYIPSQKIAIEYDGEFWHKESDVEKECFKYNECKKLGIKLYRIREDDSFTNWYWADVSWHMDNLEDKNQLSRMIRVVVDELDPRSNKWTRRHPCFHSPVNINVKRDEFKIRRYMQELKTDSLADLYPELAKEWDLEANHNLTPKMFKPGSSQRVGWKCRICGHTWETTIYSRAINHTRCPICYRLDNRGGKHAAAKKIYQYSKDWQFIKAWKCISKAARALNLNSSNISTCAKHERPFAGGFRWEYTAIEKNFQQPDLFET